MSASQYQINLGFTIVLILTGHWWPQQVTDLIIEQTNLIQWID